MRKHWTPERRAAHLRKPFKERGWDVEFSRLMGRDGWIGVGWPKEFGGQGRSATEQIAFITEMANAGAPCQAHSTGESIVAQALFCTAPGSSRTNGCPPSAAASAPSRLGYSEPEAGSDLAALRTRAVRDGDDWVVNGQKLWSTGGDKAEYMWLAVRTDPEAKKHAGISVLMVDLRSPGVTIRPSLALYGKTFSAQFYDNVRVPAKNMVGEVNNGWKVITDALAAERVMIGGDAHGGHRARLRPSHRIPEDCGGRRQGAEERSGDPRSDRRAGRRHRGGAPVPDPERAAGRARQGADPRSGHGQGVRERIAGAARPGRARYPRHRRPVVRGCAESAPLGEMEQLLRHSIMGMIGGGTNEIQRNVIAQRGLDLPR